MKKIVFLFVLLIGLGSKAQTNKPFALTKGEIAFREVSKITDRMLLEETLKISKEKVRVDTVFIETKKSFWGKEKKTIKTKSDVQDVETIDSTITEKTTDTIK